MSRIKLWLSRAVHAIWFGRGPTARAAALALAPLTLLTRGHARAARRAIGTLPPPSPPVLIIGNLVAGGTGKTPLVIGVAQALRKRGLRIGLVCNGYGAPRSDARLVDPTDDPAEHGDEAVLLALESGCPVAAGQRRDQALERLVVEHPGLDLVIADDGLQHRHLPRNLELVVFDGRGLGNGRLLPAGPLREPVPAGGRLPAIALNAAAPPPGIEAAHRFDFRVEAVGFSRPDGSEPLDLAAFRERLGTQSITALAGIGQPARFFASLAACGVPVEARLALPDHSPISPDLLASIASPLIVMTSKDAVKCREYADPRLWVLRVAAQVDPALIDWLMGALRGIKTARNPGLPGL